MIPDSLNPQLTTPSQVPGTTISPVIISSVPLAEPAGTGTNDGSLNQMPVVASPMTAPAVQQFLAADSSAPVVKKQTGKLIVSLAATAVIMFVIGYLANSGITKMGQTNASTQARAFIAALNNGDNDKAYGMTTKNLRNEQTLGQFTASMGNLEATNPAFDQQAVSFAGQNAVYSVTEDGLPTAKDGSTDGNFKIMLVRSGPIGWKIDSASVD